jgi:hypothetical protein
MQVTSFQGISDTLAKGARAGILRGQLISSANKLARDIDIQMEKRQKAVRTAWDVDLDSLHSAFDSLFNAGERLPSAYDLIASAREMEHRTDALVDEVQQAISDLASIAEVGGSHSVLPYEVSKAIAGLGQRQIDPLRHTSGILQLSRHTPTAEVLARRLANWSFLRLWSLHGLVLVSIARAKPALDQDAVTRLSGDRLLIEQHIRHYRDRLRDASRLLRRSDRGTPAFLIALWSTVLDMESWIRDEGAGKVADSCAAATAAVDANAGEAVRLARDSALIYDGVRTMLALLSGARAVLRAYPLYDRKALEQFAVAGTLSVSPATLNLPRTSVAQVAETPAGETVETAAVVLETDVTVGGPAPRTVLKIGTRTGAQLTVLLPFTAADSFGVAPGIWVQVRGKVFPDGKDDLSGPVLEVRRIQRGVAAASSFFDAMVWMGRREFEYRPAQLDIIAGRRATDLTVPAELGLRR